MNYCLDCKKFDECEKAFNINEESVACSKFEEVTYQITPRGMLGLAIIMNGSVDGEKLLNGNILEYIERELHMAGLIQLGDLPVVPHDGRTFADVFEGVIRNEAFRDIFSIEDNEIKKYATDLSNLFLKNYCE